MKYQVLLLALALTGGIATAATPKTLAPARTPEAVTKEFFDYLMSGKKEITDDKEAQGRWLTKSLRDSLQTAIVAADKAAKKNPNERIDSPENGTFIGAWDLPTKYSVKNSLSTPYLALVTLGYEWGPKTNYPGDTRTMTVVLKLEDNAWKVSDIHTHAGKFCENGSLLEELKRL